jgi:hypothetical protein
MSLLDSSIRIIAETPERQRRVPHMAYSSLLRSFNNIPMLSSSKLIIESVGTDEQEVFDSLEGFVEDSWVVVVYMAKRDSLRREFRGRGGVG